ncbi:MAG TPA: dockerin type I repeat-containing protein [Planctomycetota bacterium]|jgi:hypothetical protein|nr:dockerin type I repeat-containing protein [Planctomycetota bacterium]OQC21682.1 MAG: hypothetical protein BWX69_00612 [Planctomycetes bacterium ADurb.Bin069]NMD35221.1 hypothetical protein [Planctomycetota bacterium]HNR98938.1 dockerin type I repeat-containing protein [Planctomycetota bacterium]HNU26442.1 dockerin type I repeat-containing protein [Planctomycetota bacterium]
MRALVAFCLAGAAVNAADIDAGGFFLRWMLLGPYGQTGGDNPGCVAMERDYLTDGVVTEADVKPYPGLAINTNYAVAASTALLATPGNPQANPGGIPTWYDSQSPWDTIDFQGGAAYNTDVDYCMAYACIYVKNLTGAAIANCRALMSSDDGIQLIVGATSVWCNSVPRGVGEAGYTPDTSGLFTLPAGITRFMVKVFEGGGGWAFRLKLQDGAGAPLLGNRIALTTLPYGPCPTASTVTAFADAWSRRAVIQWEHPYSLVRIYEGGLKLAETSDYRAQELVVGDLDLGPHVLEFRANIGEGEPACAVVTKLVEVTPVWPADFQCAYDDLSGRILFTWRNIEPYYEILKIQENGVDVLGLSYGVDSAVLVAGAPGTYTFTLVAELAGYASGGIACTVEVAGPSPAFRRGDANADGVTNIADAVFALAYMFTQGAAPSCPDTADANDDGTLDISDVVAVLRYLFTGGSIPLPGAQVCGPDPTSDTLGRCVYTACD